MTVSHIAEVAALLAVSYVVGLLVGMLARRLVTRPASKPVAVTAASVAAAPVDSLAVAAPVVAATAEPEITAPAAASAQAEVVASDVPGASVQASGEVSGAPVMAVTAGEAAPVAIEIPAAVTEKIEAQAEVVTPAAPPAQTVVGPMVVDDALVPFDTLAEPPKPIETVVAPPPPSQEEILAGLASVAAKTAEEATVNSEIVVIGAETSGAAPVVDVPVESPAPAEAPSATMPAEVSEPVVATVPPPMQPDDLIAALSAVVPSAAAVEPVVEKIEAAVVAELPAPTVASTEPPAVTVAAEPALPELPLATTVSIGGTTVQPDSEVKAPEAAPTAEVVLEETPAPQNIATPVAVAPVETPKAPVPPIATVPSNFDDLLTQLTSIAAKARAVRDGGDGDAGNAGTAGGAARPAATAGARPARVPGFAWGGTIRGRSATVYVAKAGPLQPTSTAASAPAASTPPARSTAPVSERKTPAATPAGTSAMAPTDSRPQVSDASVRAVLFESIASELDVALPTQTSPASGSPPTTPPAPVQAPTTIVDAPPTPVTPVAQSAQPPVDEDDAMRAIEGGWSRTRTRALSGTPDIADLGAAVSAAQIAVETVLARNGIDPAQGAASVRPKGLPKPRNGKRDNLQSIKGVGALDEIALNNLGIFHFDQVAEWDQKTILWLENHAFARGRIAREEWQPQARALLGDVGDLKVSR